MRCRAFNYPGAPPQVLGVFWDDEKVASLELKARFMQTSFVVSADRATPGSHRLAFIPAYFGRPERTGHAGRVPKHSRKLSFACDWIALGNGPDAGKARGEGETLWIPAASEVSFFLELEQDLELRWEGVAPRGVVGLDVVWEVEGAVPVTDFITEESAPTLRLPLPPLGEQAAALEPSSPVGEGRSESILLWIVDTLRVDRLGFYGHDRPVSPNFDALAQRSTVFERAIAQSSWTRPTVATLLTGVGPERHGIRELSHGLEESFATLPERLKELGYATAGFSANANVIGDTGFGQGFDRFEYGEVDADELVGRALAWLDELTARSPEQPFFLMILSVEPHASFAPAEPFRSRFAAGVDDPELGSVAHMRALSSKKAPRAPDVVEKLFLLYDAEIAWNDHVFGELQHELDRRGRDPVIAVVADHGEAFEERGVFGHARGTFTARYWTFPS